MLNNPVNQGGIRRQSCDVTLEYAITIVTSTATKKRLILQYIRYVGIAFK